MKYLVEIIYRLWYWISCLSVNCTYKFAAVLWKWCDMICDLWFVNICNIIRNFIEISSRHNISFMILSQLFISQLYIQFCCSTLWARLTKNTDWSTGPPACPFACSLIPLTHSPALPCLLCLRTPLHSLISSLVGQWMMGWLFILCFFLFWTTVHYNHAHCCFIFL